MSHFLTMVRRKPVTTLCVKKHLRILSRQHRETDSESSNNGIYSI